MEAKKRPEWKPWSERLDIVISREEKKGSDEAHKGNSGKGNQGEQNPDTESLVQQNSDVVV